MGLFLSEVHRLPFFNNVSPVLRGGDFQIDYDPDDAEPEEPAPAPLQHDESEESAEVMNRVLRLLEEQRLHSQALVAKKFEQETAGQQKERLFASLMGATPLAVLPLLDDMAADQALLLKDMNGLNLLHVSARLGCWEVMDRLLEINTQLCDQMTSPVGRPAHWTPLMILIDAGHVRDPDAFKYMLTRLLEESSLTTIEARAANGSSVLHMATSKGMFSATKKILYAVYNKGNADLAAFGLVTSMLNTPNGRGAGCVSWLRSNTYTETHPQ